MGSVEKYSRQIYANYQFLVYVENIELKFSKVSGIESGAETEEISIGGMNDEACYVVNPRRKAGVLTLERGITFSGLTRLWRPGLHICGPIEVFVMSNLKARTCIHSYYMVSGVITKWEINGLDALGSEIIVDKFQITHSGIMS